MSTALATESDFYDECTFVITAIESMDLMVLQPYVELIMGKVLRLYPSHSVRGILYNHFFGTARSA